VSLNFEILIDDYFINHTLDQTLTPIERKRVLSLINDFEDGKWRFANFHEFIWDNIMETSLSQNERQCLIGRGYSALRAAAKNLRLTDKKNDIGKGSELAEIVLYGIMKHKYNALPVVPKIFYKQNSQDNAKGADSVHIVIEPAGDFSLWFGEAKFYNSIEDARLNEIIDSVGNSLDTNKLRKENSIIVNTRDLDDLIKDPVLLSSIKEALSNKISIDCLKPKINVPILLLHECKVTSKSNKMTDAYREKIKQFHKDRATSFFKKQLERIGGLNDYAKISFHLILFPVPEKKAIIETFIKKVKQFKEE